MKTTTIKAEGHVRRVNRPGGLIVAAVLLSFATLLPPVASAAPSYPVERTSHVGAAPDTVRAQTREVRIIHADLLEGEILDGERVRRLTGSVHLRQEQTDLWARRAIQYLDREEILFEGNVRIVEDADTLDAERILYFSDTKVGRASGNVQLSDGEMLARGPSGRYFVREKRAEFDEGVQLEDSVSVLTSRAGQYWTEEKRAEFYGDVILEQEGYTIHADSLTHLRETEFSIARSNVFMIQVGDGEQERIADSLHFNYLLGDYAEYDNRTEYSRVRGNALLMRVDLDADSPDTLFIRGHEFETNRNDSLRRLVATGSVETWRENFAARSDSTVYDRITLNHVEENGDEGEEVIEDIRIFTGPIAWVRESQITGDSMRIARREHVPDSLYVRENAFVASYDSLIARINQLKGVSLFGLFEDDDITFLNVYPNAEAIYFVKNDDDLLDGAVSMSSDTISFWFHDGDVSRVRASRDVEGLYYEADDVPEPFLLEGFNWMPDRRPLKEDFLRDERLQERGLVRQPLIVARPDD